MPDAIPSVQASHCAAHRPRTSRAPLYCIPLALLYPHVHVSHPTITTALTPLLIPKRARLCACGSTLGLGMDYFCSTACARADALSALSAAPSHYRALVAVAPTHWRIVRGVLYETSDAIDIPTPTSTRARRSSGVLPGWRCSPVPAHPQRPAPALERVRGTVTRLRTTLRRAASALPRVSRAPPARADDVLDAVRALERQIRDEDLRARWTRRPFELDSDEEW